MKKKLCLLTAFILALSLLSLPAFAVVDKSEDFYVADYASVLSEETKQVIIDTNGYLEQNCSGAQIVVVTIEYLDTYQYSDEYANISFQQLGRWRRQRKQRYASPSRNGRGQGLAFHRLRHIRRI